MVDLETTAGNQGSTAVSRSGVVGICSMGPYLVFVSHPADLGQGCHRKTPPPPALMSTSHSVGPWPPWVRDAGESGVQREKRPNLSPSGETEAEPVVLSVR